MNPGISADASRLTLHLNGETLRLEPWGPDGVRVRAGQQGAGGQGDGAEQGGG